MSTFAHECTKWLAREWEKIYASAVFSGIVPDAAHLRRNSYHNSLEDNPDPTGFSCNRVDDKAPPGNWPRNLAAAIDMSMNPSDMKLCSDRLWSVWNDKTDPRRIYLNAFNGWFNDANPAKRYDYVTQGISNTTSDHKWHVHAEERRRWVTSMVAAVAILSALKGETKEQYLESLEEDDDMFCNHGDNNGKVWVLQRQINKVLAFLAIPEAERLKLDGWYGDNTAARLMFIGVGNPQNGGKHYWEGEYEKLNDMLIDIKVVKAAKPSPEELRAALVSLLPGLKVTGSISI